MSIVLATAACYALAICALHVIGGGATIHRPIQRSMLPLELRAISAVIWHLVTAVLFLMGLALAWLSVRPEPGLAMVLIAICLSWAAVFIWYGHSMLGSLKPMPQWVLFLSLAGLIAAGMWA